MEQKVGDAHMLAAGTNRRNYQMDNLKCLLIFSVVFGHMLELFMGKNSPERVIYLVIYSFHMPLFAFVSGVFARYNPSKIKNNMIYPYLIFQTLYLLFSNQIGQGCGYAVYDPLLAAVVSFCHHRMESGAAPGAGGGDEEKNGHAACGRRCQRIHRF